MSAGQEIMSILGRGRTLDDSSEVASQSYSVVAKDRQFLPRTYEGDSGFAAGLGMTTAIIPSGLLVSVLLAMGVPAYALVLGPILMVILWVCVATGMPLWPEVGDTYRVRRNALEGRSDKSREELSDTWYSNYLYTTAPNGLLSKSCLIASSMIIPRKYTLEFSCNSGQVVARVQETVYLGHVVKSRTEWYKSERASFDDAVNEIQKTSRRAITAEPTA